MADKTKEREPWKSPYEEQIKQTSSELASRKPFQYDFNGDAYYQHLKDQAISGGKKAMADTMGKAQGMTGGYGNSYAMNVGQQAYNASLQGLADQAINLGEVAYSRYRQEGADMKDRLDRLQGLENRDYQRYMDDRQMALQDEDRAQRAQDAAYGKLMDLIQMGYKPTPDELAEAGLTGPQFQAIWDKLFPAAPSGGGGGHHSSSVGPAAPPSSPDTQEEDGPAQYDWDTALAYGGSNSPHIVEQMVNSGSLAIKDKPNSKGKYEFYKPKKKGK